MNGVPALREAQVPLTLDVAVVREPLVEATRDAVLFRVPNVGRFLVRGVGPTLFERAAGATDADLACFREGPVAAAAALLRGELALRAASVSIAGRAVILCGPSAVGKSALAATLGQRGHSILADAVTVISWEPDAKQFSVSPLAPEPVLWPDSAEELGLDVETGRRVRPALAKRAYRLGGPPSPAPLAAVAFLRVDPLREEPALEPLSGGAKLRALLGAGWHLRLVDPLGLAASRFRAFTELAAIIPAVRIVRPPRGASPALLADLVEELVP